MNIHLKTFTKHCGIAAPLFSNNVDTDQIIPSREMKRVSKVGLSEGLFSGQRFHYDGLKKTGLNHQFVLNQAPYHKATILLTGKNFGCGSSREHAVWALAEFGFRVIVAESFGEIFRNNCIRNGVLPIVLKRDQIKLLADSCVTDPESQLVTIDLENRTAISADGETFQFQLEEYQQKMLMNGWDFIDLALQQSDVIDEFVARDRQQRSWAYL